MKLFLKLSDIFTLFYCSQSFAVKKQTKKKHLVSCVSQPAGAQHLVVMDLDTWLGTMLRTEGSRVKKKSTTLQLSMKYICQMHDIQTDGESLTLCCKHAALFDFLFFIDLFGCLFIYLCFKAFIHLKSKFRCFTVTVSLISALLLQRNNSRTCCYILMQSTKSAIIKHHIYLDL